MTFYLDSWAFTLPTMLSGMIGIFLVIGCIVLAVYLLARMDRK